MLLPQAYRSLSRPSSPHVSEASTMSPYSLDHISLRSYVLVPVPSHGLLPRRLLSRRRSVNSPSTTGHPPAARTRRFGRSQVILMTYASEAVASLDTAGPASMAHCCSMADQRIPPKPPFDSSCVYSFLLSPSLVMSKIRRHSQPTQGRLRQQKRIGPE